MIRQPAVAGHFYPADPEKLRTDIEMYLRDTTTQSGLPGPAGPSSASALLVPHAGYIYSGRVAGAAYASARLPRALLILCPNHTGAGRAIAVMNRGTWMTPLGAAAVDEDLADRVLQCCGTAEVDFTAHRDEHSLEVQIPFLQVLLGEFTFVPICVGTGRLSALLALGNGLCTALRGWRESVGVIISSDMSHYIPAEKARVKDMAAIEMMVSLDPEGLHRVVQEQEISMCGFAPAVAGLAAVKEAGSREGRLIAYGNSGDASGDYGRVVAYAGLAFS